MYIYGANRIGVPVQVNVIGTMIFLVAVGFVAITTWLQSRANRPPRADKPLRQSMPEADPVLAARSEA
jgi:hypothetical protein